MWCLKLLKFTEQMMCYGQIDFSVHPNHILQNNLTDQSRLPNWYPLKSNKIYILRATQCLMLFRFNEWQWSYWYVYVHQKHKLINTLINHFRLPNFSHLQNRNVIENALIIFKSNDELNYSMWISMDQLWTSRSQKSHSAKQFSIPANILQTI